LSEDMGMPPLQFVGDGAGHVSQVEGLLLRGELGVEDDLEEQIPQLLAQRRPRAPGAHAVHLVEDLEGLLDQVGAQAAEILLAIPGTSVRGTQPPHDLCQPLQLTSNAHALQAPSSFGQGGTGPLPPSCYPLHCAPATCFCPLGRPGALCRPPVPSPETRFRRPSRRRGSAGAGRFPRCIRWRGRPRMRPRMSMSRSLPISLLLSLLLFAPAVAAQGTSAIEDAWGDPEPPPTEAAAPSPASSTPKTRAVIEDAWGDPEPPAAEADAPAGASAIDEAWEDPAPPRARPADTATPAPRSRAATPRNPGADASGTPPSSPQRRTARRTAAAPEAPAPEASGETPIPDAIPLATSRMIRDVDLAEAFRTWRDAVT